MESLAGRYPGGFTARLGICVLSTGVRWLISIGVSSHQNPWSPSRGMKVLLILFEAGASTGPTILDAVIEGVSGGSSS